MTTDTPTTAPAEAAVDLKTAGILAEFEKPGDLIRAAEAVRNAGFTRFDCFTPFPVHGIDDAMGIKPTILPFLVITLGITGTLFGFGLTWWTNAIAYPMNISGKALWAWQANVPVAFETTVLFAALTAFLSVFILNGLPMLWHAVFHSPKFLRATSDRFVLYIDADDARFIPHDTAQFVAGLHPLSFETVKTPAVEPPMPAFFQVVGGVTALLAILPPLLILKAQHSKNDLPRYHAIFDMDIQPKFKAQSSGLAMFADGRSTRVPPTGTIARGGLRTDVHLYEGLTDGKPAVLLPSSVKVDAATVARGQARYNIYCSACHGYDGQGQGMVNRRVVDNQSAVGWNPPANLADPRIVKQPIGEIYRTIAHGIERPGASATEPPRRTMPGYGPQIPVEDRWAIALYVRAIQQSFHHKTQKVGALVPAGDAVTRTDGGRGNQ